MLNNLVARHAELFATAAHKGQTRKYSSAAYIHHPARVAAIVRSAGLGEEAEAAAWLHDVLEDTPVTYVDLVREFGPAIARLVLELTEFSTDADGTRATRKALDRRYLERVSVTAKSIKLADLIDNTADIVANDPDFARIYLAEKRLLLPLLSEGNAELYRRAWRILCDGEHVLNGEVINHERATNGECVAGGRDAGDDRARHA